MDTIDSINLGKSDIKISVLGLGTMQWGDFGLPEDAKSNSDQPIREVFQVSLEKGITFYDTAEMYGNGKSEEHMGRFLKEFNPNIVIATKFMPYPWRLTRMELRSALLRSLNRLGLTQVDLYQMHWPFPPVPIPSWMEAMADAVQDGLIKAVGVSNYSPQQTRLAYQTLEKYHITLASNQVRYSMLDRSPEKSGLVHLCKELGVTMIAYSPLEKGILTGKYTPENLPTGFRSWRYNKAYLKRSEPLINELRIIGEFNGGKSPAMVALNWLICKGIVPIPGARNKMQALENAGALGWKLRIEEVSRLDNLSNSII